MFFKVELLWKKKKKKEIIVLGHLATTCCLEAYTIAIDLITHAMVCLTYFVSSCLQSFILWENNNVNVVTPFTKKWC